MTQQGQFDIGTAADAALRVGGIGVVFGAAMITVISALYATSPVPATMPVVAERLREALDALHASNGSQLWWIGIVGLTGDVIFAAAAFLVSSGLVLRGQPVQALGWLGFAVSNIIFVGVDALVGRTLVNAASVTTAEPGFVAAKSLADALFTSGTFAFGVGALLAFLPTLIAGGGTLPRRLLSLAGVVIGLFGTGSAIACLLGVDAGSLLGLAIAAGSVVVLIIGALLATSATY